MDYYYRLPGAFRRRLLTKEDISALLSINFKAARAKSMTAALFREYCQKAGLICISQETFNWGRGTCLIDAISVFGRQKSRWDKDTRSLENAEFLENAGLTSRLARLYCS
jgi:hypothetical protein